MFKLLVLAWRYRAQLVLLAQAFETFVQDLEDLRARKRRAAELAQALHQSITRKDTHAIEAFLRSGGNPPNPSADGA